ncbi:Hypothetical protein NGAL_HAMBI2605_55580 [Neorhizobium galegae bv. orientalis]|nr:Hypothetical protein NGAL_HAMBI2566_57690 [Neorhizobium galegae bv. orientalis]CDZ67278.1 Hypothetical protein NGAL_HAMBI2605_55580 [Neorhizobium galegae bv. orientalis]
MVTVIEKIVRQIMARASFSPLAISRATDAVIDTYGAILAGAN